MGNHARLRRAALGGLRSTAPPPLIALKINSAGLVEPDEWIVRKEDQTGRAGRNFVYVETFTSTRWSPPRRAGRRLSE